MTIVETDVMVIGSGPSGGAMALALAKSGISVTVVNRFGWTCRTPRAHITNPRALEVLHDLGVMDDVRAYAVPNSLIGEAVVCDSIVGDEFGRVRAFGTHPDLQALYAEASPETTVDLPQNFLESILAGAAAHQGSNFHFHTEFLRFEQDETGVDSHVVNRITGHEFVVRSKYLVGADGANSLVATQAGLPFLGKKAKAGGAVNIVFDADLARYTEHRPGVLYWVLRERENKGYLAVLRMIRPWKRWLVMVPWDLSTDKEKITRSWASEVVHDVLGNGSIDIDICSISLFTINEQWAEKIQCGRVFCVGDAIHRHPPYKGLGSNTCLQDSFNLAWKLVYVLKGWAGPSLLNSFDDERQPIAEQVVKSAFSSRQYFDPSLAALIDTAQHVTLERPTEVLRDTLASSSRLRAKMIDSIVASRPLYDSPGLEIDHRYVSAAVLPPTDEKMPERPIDPELRYKPTTFPGARLPHGWVFRDGRKTSLLYLCGRGKFTLLTGNSGRPWREAAEAITETHGVPVDVKIIGPGQDYEDLYGDFRRLSEVEESGAVLVRPDMHVAWRAQRWEASSTQALRATLASILGWDSLRGSETAMIRTREESVSIYDEFDIINI